MGKRNRKSVLLRASFIEALESRVLLNSAISPTYNPVEGEGWDVGTLDGSGNLYVPSNANVSAYQVRENSITVDPYGTLQIDGASAGAFDPSHVSIVNGLNIAQTNGQFSGTLNLNNTVLIIRAQPGETNAQAVLMLNYVSSALQSGFNEGLWNGMGITSSAAAYDAIYGSGDTALGVLLNDDGTGTNTPIYTSLLNDGSIPLYDNDIVIADTLYGDADLNGTVNLDDFSDWLAGFQDPSVDPVWQNGNFLYENSVSLDDFTMWQSYEGLSIPVSTVPQGGIYNPNYLASFPAPSDATSDTPYVTWGDGSSSEPAAFVLENGQMNVLDTHVYNSPGVYSGWVYLTDSSGNQSGTFTMNVGVVPPTGLTATYISPTQVDLSWTNNASDVQSYSIQDMTGATGSLNGGWNVVGSTSQTPFGNYNITNSTFSAGQTYSFQVLANYTGSNYNTTQSASNIATLTIPSYPGAPSFATATALSSSEIQLTWAANGYNNTDVEGFTIQRSPAGTGNWVTIAYLGGDVYSYLDTGLTEGTPYDYQIFATNYAGYSQAAGFGGDGTTLDAAPTNLTVTSLSNSSAVLGWMDNSNAPAYDEIDYSTNGINWTAEAFPRAANGNETYTLSGTFNIGELCYFRVQTQDSLWDSTVYDPDANQDLDPNYGTEAPPAPPAHLMTTQVYDTEINLAWSNSDSSTTGFILQRQTGSSGYSTIATLDVSQNTYIDGGLNPDSTYDYQIAAFGPGGTSSFVPATALPVTTLPSAPTAVTATVGAEPTTSAQSGGQINLSWTAPSGVPSYQDYVVQMSTDGVNYSTAVGTLSGTSFATSASLSAGSYDFRVATYDSGAGDSEWAYSDEVDLSVQQDFPVLDTISINSYAEGTGNQGPTAYSDISLQAGVPYVLQVSGEPQDVTPINGTNYYSDAVAGQDESSAWVPSAGGILFRVMINGVDPGWGPYNSSHVYTTTIIGTGGPLSAYYSEDYTGDNAGSFTLEIMSLGDSVTVSDFNHQQNAVTVPLPSTQTATIYVPEHIATTDPDQTQDGTHSAEINITGQSGDTWNISGTSGSSFSTTSGTIGTQPTEVTVMPPSGDNGSYTIHVTSSSGTSTVNAVVLAWEIDADTEVVDTESGNVVPGDLLPVSQKSNPGAFVPVDDGDSDYDGFADDAEPNGAPPPDGDDRLLSINLNATSDPNLGDYYTVSDAFGLRIFETGQDGISELPPNAHIPSNDGATIFAEGTTPGPTALIIDWTVNGTTYQRVDFVEVNVFEMGGALDVPGNGTYEYLADGSRAPHELDPLPSTSAWQAPFQAENPEDSAGAITSYVGPTGYYRDVDVQWDNLPVVGALGFYVNDDYSWRADVNVVQVGYASPAAPLQAFNTNAPNATINGVYNNILRCFVSAHNYACAYTLELTLTGPDGGRGVSKMSAGFIQNGVGYTLIGRYTSGRSLASEYSYTITPSSPVLDSASVDSAWAVDKPFAVVSNPGPVNGTFQGEIGASDDPDVGIPVDYDEDTAVQPGDDILTSVEININFDLSLCLKTSDDVNGSDAEYVPEAFAQWSWVGNGSFDGSWEPDGASVSAPSTWSQPPAGYTPVTTAPSFNTLARSEDFIDE